MSDKRPLTKTEREIVQGKHGQVINAEAVIEMLLRAEQYWREAVAEADPLDLHDARVSPPEYLCRFCGGIGVYEKIHKPDCAWLLAEEI